MVYRRNDKMTATMTEYLHRIYVFSHLNTSEESSDQHIVGQVDSVISANKERWTIFSQHKARNVRPKTSHSCVDSLPFIVLLAISLFIHASFLIKLSDISRHGDGFQIISSVPGVERDPEHICSYIPTCYHESTFRTLIVHKFSK